VAADKNSTKWLTFDPRWHTFNHMVELQDARLDAVFHALGDATRRGMLRRLSQGERSVGQLAEPFSMSLAAASKHVKALEGAGLIRREVRGRQHICRLEAGPLAAANDWLRFYEQFWSARLDRLEELLRHDAATANGTAASPAQGRRTARRGTRTDPRPKPRRAPR
jgi:DNA-binding transcriptional ArsR family regulator